MIQYFSKIRGQKIIGSHSSQKIALVENLLIDYEKGIILAIQTDKEEKIISFIDIIKWGSPVTVSDDSVLISPQEIVRITQLGYYSLLNQPVKTQEGESVGFVQDFMFETNTGYITYIYVSKKSFGFKYDRRIISRNYIMEINKKAVIVKNNILQEKVSKRELLSMWKKGLVPKPCSFRS